jgi:type I restriction enzyme, S subunit
MNKFNLFGDLFEFSKKSKIKAGDGQPIGKFPFYTSSDNQTKFLDEFQFEGPSLIFGTGGSSSVHFDSGQFSASTDCFIVKAKDRNKTFENYVYYYLIGNQHLLEEGFKGAGLKHISKEYISNISIPQPPLHVQQKIAAILDKADKLRQKDKQLLKLYNDLGQSVFYEMFGNPVKNEKGWPISEIQNLVNKERPITYGILKPGANIKPDGIPFIRVLDIKDNEVLVDQVNHTNTEIAKQYKRSTLKKDDILYSIRGHVGRSCLVPQELEGANITQDTARLDFTGSLNNHFALSYLKTEEFDRLVRPLIRGAAVKGLNLGDLRKLPIPVPSLELQNKFQTIILSIKKQRRSSLESVIKSESLFQSLLQSAFKGELVS